MKFPEQFRIRSLPKGYEQYETKTGDPCGMFTIPQRHGMNRMLKVIATDGTDGEGEGLIGSMYQFLYSLVQNALTQILTICHGGTKCVM